jgi:hypothetical protein
VKLDEAVTLGAGIVASTLACHRVRGCGRVEAIDAAGTRSGQNPEARFPGAVTERYDRGDPLVHCGAGPKIAPHPVMLKLELNDQEALLLRLHLSKHLRELDDELVHTDKHQLQHELLREEDRLRTILQRLDRLIESSQAIA